MRFTVYYIKYPRYLANHRGTSALTDDLWRALDFGLEKEGPRVDEVMDLWTTWKGFPKIKVTPFL